MRHYLFILIILVLSCTGLENDEPEENPVEVIEVLLPQAQVALARAAGGVYALYQSVIMQQLAGTDAVLMEVDRYLITPAEMEKSWELLYINVFSNLNSIIEYAEKTGLYKARGMARIMMANGLGLVASVWGDVPFSESFLTDNVNLRPAYDSQEVLYETIISLLEGGIEDLNSHGNQIFPGDQDKFYKGNKDKWIRLATFLLLRYSLHLSEVRDYHELISLAGNSMFQEPGEKLELKFSEFEEFTHPLYEFFIIYPGSVRAGFFIVNEMYEVDDPRLPVFFKATESGQVEGSAAGEGNQSASRISSAFISSGSPVVLASYTEQKFTQAEVYLENGMHEDAIEAFNQGLLSSLLDFNVYNDEWYLQNKAEGVLTIEQLLKGKYIAMFLQPVVWSDWRRKGYPQIEPSVNNNTGNLIPRRFPYPESEYLFNGDNVPAGIDITTPVWWDQ